MPMTVELGEVAIKSRSELGLPDNTCLFCFSFDLNSSIHRKNPQACVEAFQKAFPSGGESLVGLVVKVHPPKKPHMEWERFKLIAAEDPRIIIVEETLSRPDLLALYSACDCFLSLHRAEGFGRGIAEAILLGLHVITTGYSGNVDFCTSPNVSLVNYRLVPVGPGDYPFHEQQVWADVDTQHAADLMISFYSQQHTQVKDRDDTIFSAEVIGASYKKHLDRIWTHTMKTRHPNN